ncbi:MAG: ComF family protein [Stellaceae bacterium]
MLRARRGLPFEVDLGADVICGACARETPLYARARAAMRYDDASRTLVLAFKHGDKLQFAPALGRFMRRADAELLAACDVIVPVPLHWTRLFARRYNQAAVLARGGGPPSLPTCFNDTARPLRRAAAAAPSAGATSAAPSP